MATSEIEFTCNVFTSQFFQSTANKPGANQSGSITLLFCFLLVVLLGSISFSTWIGSQVHEKIKLQNSADFAAIGVASHASTGLNMIAANNIAIAANLHIAAATPMIPRYYALAQALLTSPSSISKELATWTVDPDKTSYAKLYQPVEALTAHFLSGAAGLTKLNQGLASHWMYVGLPKALETMRANEAGSIGLVLPRNSKLSSGTDLQNAVTLKYRRLKLTSFQDAACHSVKASQGIGQNRHLASFWLGAPLGTVGNLDTMIQSFQSLEKGVRTVVDIIESTRAPATAAAKAAYYSFGCGIWGIKKSSHCKIIGKVLRFFQDPVPLPEFTQQCGLNYQGDMANQAGSFMKWVDTNAYPIGFTVPDIKSISDVIAWEQSLDYAAVQARPIIQASDLAKPDNLTTCPNAFKFEVQDQTFCDLVRWPTDMPLSALSIWDRTQWAIGKARAVYQPEQSGETGHQHHHYHNDPISAKTDGLPLPPDSLTARTQMKLFWPAWQVEYSSSNTNPELLNFLTSF